MQRCSLASGRQLYIARLPRTVSQTARQSQFTRAAFSVQFPGISMVSYRGQYALRKCGDKKRVKCTEMQCVSKHAESSLSAWFTYVVQNRSTVLAPKHGPVQRVSRWTTCSQTSLILSDTTFTNWETLQFKKSKKKKYTTGRLKIIM